jgi:hypothetical protein
MKTKYGKWTVIGVPFNKPYEKKKVLCRCSCGKEKTVLTWHLKAKLSKGCRACAGLKHGCAKKSFSTLERSTYSSYINMCSRCNRPSKFKAHKCYRERPVQLCNRWKIGGFKLFLKDMGLKPSLRHSIDRINNDNLIYSPRNCRWATPTEQIRNSRWYKRANI